ncbi:MAG: hypothetical protein WAW36_01110 [Methylovulum miyakonense]|uniref:hypothetical protein n=1 Tax=Methylovulum miyakonense TaxID=645578 RepID=UPI003BB6D056
MKHFIILEDTDSGSIHIQSLRQGTAEALAQEEAGLHSPASLLAASLIAHAITYVGGETAEKTAKVRIHAAVSNKH